MEEAMFKDVIDGLESLRYEEQDEEVEGTVVDVEGTDADVEGTDADVEGIDVDVEGTRETSGVFFALPVTK
ncbi:hypothetical protein LSTR_LSTR011616 [Laodelphax striatellus]|uniref:Uncharacterized protein n=1 Tax=Laodelphax striatellus TaxID=195883 RepID=A0A482X8P0_LAOST|nr:hypothetical protein LSTR_LSTR011616 [Laodelphax striatellus]